MPHWRARLYGRSAWHCEPVVAPARAAPHNRRHARQKEETKTTIATTEYVLATDALAITVDAVADVGNARTVVLVRKDAADAPIE